MRRGRPASECRRSASRNGRMPERRMNAITTSRRSADAISATSWLPTRGSPGAFVRTVVSSSGMSGSGIVSLRPSGSRARMACKTAAGATGASSSAVTSRMVLPISSTSRRASVVATATRSSSVTAARARWITRPRCSAIRSGASAARSGSLAASQRSSRPSNRPWSASVISSSYRPRGWSDMVGAVP